MRELDVRTKSYGALMDLLYEAKRHRVTARRLEGLRVHLLRARDVCEELRRRHEGLAEAEAYWVEQRDEYARELGLVGRALQGEEVVPVRMVEVRL